MPGHQPRQCENSAPPAPIGSHSPRSYRPKDLTRRSPSQLLGALLLNSVLRQPSMEQGTNTYSPQLCEWGFPIGEAAFGRDSAYA